MPRHYDSILSQSFQIRQSNIFIIHLISPRECSDNRGILNERITCEHHFITQTIASTPFAMSWG